MKKPAQGGLGGGMDAIWRVFDPIILGWLCALVVLSLLDHWRGRK